MSLKKITISLAILLTAIFNVLTVHDGLASVPQEEDTTEEDTIIINGERLSALPDDVASIDAIMSAVYDVISGPKGRERDWNRFRSLFIDEARLIPRAPDEVHGVAAMTPAEYVERASGFFFENGFYETEIARKTDQYGDIAQVFSTYESRRSPGEEPFARGINSFQLLYHDGRWWVVTIYWQGETDQFPIPDQYLPENSKAE